MRKIYQLSMMLGAVALISCSKEMDMEQISTSDPDNYDNVVVSAPRVFSSAEELVCAVNALREGNLLTKSETNSFVSYYETVMQECGYDDRPNAIYSEAFGAILNSAGEVIYGDIFVKVGEEGIFYGPLADSCTVRQLASFKGMSQMCEKAVCPYFSEDADTYSVTGYDGIYVVDTFGYISGSQNESYDTADGDIHTKVYVDGVYQELTVTAGQLFGGTGSAADWSKSFTKPNSGDQKVKFSDKKHCNDTKMFQQHYGVDSEDGIKTKTMKKRLGTVWDKVNNPLEAGIKNISIRVLADFKNCTSNDICYTAFQNKRYYVYVHQMRGTSANWVANLNDSSVKSYLTKGTQFASEINYNKTPEAVLFVLDNDTAILRFPDKYRYESNNSVMKVPWLTPFGGVFAAKDSRTNAGWTTAGQFHVEKLDAYACSIRGNDKKGTMLHYKYQ